MSSDAGQSIIQTAPKFCYYHLPFGDEYRPDIVTPQEAPIRFAFLLTPALGPIALQAVYYGIDPASGRPGNPFVHLLFNDLDHHLDAYTVLASWQSPFWQVEATRGEGELEDVEALDQGGFMDDTLLVECAQQEDGWLDNVAFLLNAFLQLEPTRQIFIVGEPRDIVGMLFALVRLVPTTWRRTITFSTYEKQIEGHDIRFVGTTWGTTSPERDLPNACYTGRAAALNLKTGRRSPEISHLSYTAFAIDQLAKDALVDQVDPFLHLCQLAGIEQPDEIETVFQSYYAIVHDVTLNPPILQTLFQYPPLTTHASQSEGFQNRLLDAIETTPAMTQGLETHLSAYFSANEPAALLLAERFGAHVAQHVHTGKVDQLDALIHHVMPLIPALTQPLQRLFRDLSDDVSHPPKTISVDVRSYLLQVWRDIEAFTDDPERLNPWLTVSSAEELEALLGSLKSPALRAQVLSLNLTNGIRPNDRTLSNLMNKPAFIVDYLQSVAREQPTLAFEVACLFTPIASNGYLLQLLDIAQVQPSQWMAPFLTTITGNQRAPFIHQYGYQFLKVIGQEPAFEAFLTRFEADHQSLLGQSASLLTFYGRCVEQHVLKEDSLLKRIEAWQYLGQLKAPELTSQKARGIGQHVASLQSALTPERHNALQLQLLTLLAQACISPLSRVDVESAVFVLGPAFINADTFSRPEFATWEGLCRLALEDKALLSHDIFTWDLMRVRTGVIKNDPRRKRMMLEWTELSPTGVELLNRLPKKTRNVLMQDQVRWPRESQKTWGNWMNKHKRQGVVGRMKTLWGRS